MVYVLHLGGGAKGCGTALLTQYWAGVGCMCAWQSAHAFNSMCVVLCCAACCVTSSPGAGCVELAADRPLQTWPQQPPAAPTRTVLHLAAACAADRQLWPHPSSTTTRRSNSSSSTSSLSTSTTTTTQPQAHSRIHHTQTAASTATGAAGGGYQQSTTTAAGCGWWAYAAGRGGAQ